MIEFYLNGMALMFCEYYLYCPDKGFFPSVWYWGEKNYSLEYPWSSDEIFPW